MIFELIAIVGASVVNLDGGAPIENAVVIVDGEKVTAVGPADTTPVPSEASRIDATGTWLIPGLVNVHVHLGLVLPGLLEAELANESDAARALRMAKNARDTLRAGVTTIRLPGDSRHADIALARAIERGQAD